MPFSFSLSHTLGRARAGVFATPHGAIATPAFMAVGTLATVKALDPDELEALGAQMILANAYHLHLRPGDELVREMGGLHRFMAWGGPMLTDSGGYQVFSLEGLRTVTEDGVDFQSHLDGSRRFFTPELVMRIERNLGADVMMQFDHVVPGQSAEPTAREAMERSVRWLERCLAEFERLGREGLLRQELASVDGVSATNDRKRRRQLELVAVRERRDAPLAPPDAHFPAPEQALFPIVQGGIHASLRAASARAIRGLHDWVGFGLGGLSVGEPKPDMYAMLDVMDDELPRDRPRP